MADLVLPDLAKALNPEQHLAATTTEGPLLVLAGAGSGKTRVLVHRIAHILAEKKAKPWQILAVTFTNKAAAEMRSRLEALVGPMVRDAWIGTFHALSARMLRIEGHRLGYHGGFSIYDAEDSKRLLKAVMKAMDFEPTGHYGVNLQKVSAEIDKAKNAGLGPKAFADSVDDFAPPARRAAKAIYFKYQDALRRANAMDFGDLVRLATELLAHHPEAYARFGQRFRYVMVDEFQDTNEIQYRFLRQLVREHRNLMVVGDDDQSIYRWRGAEVAHILGFDDEHPDCEVVKLEENYRSTANILAAANAVIAKNQSRHPKKLRTRAPGGAKVGLALVPHSNDEAQLVAELIRERVDEGREPHEHAILFRMNAQSRLFEEALSRARVPYRLVGGTGFYERMEVKDIVSYLRLLVNPSSTQDFLRVVNTPIRGIGQKTVERLRLAAETAGLDGLRMLELSDGALESAGLAKGAVKKLRAFGALMAELTYFAIDAEPSAVARAVVEKTGYVHHLLKQDEASAEDRTANVEELVSSIADRELELIEAGSELAEALDEDAGLGIAGAKTPLEAFLDEASLASGEKSDGSPGGVQLMTLHAAKGLEFPVVFMVGMEDKTFPSKRALESDDEKALEEERRLCYVGMTRAMEELHLTAARRRVIFGATELRDPSSFLGDLPDEVVASARRGGAAPPLGRSAPARVVDPFDDFLGGDDDDDPNPFAEEEDDDVFRVDAPVDDRPRSGERAFHKTFGEGEILGVDGTGPKRRVRVRFSDGSVRTVVARFLELG